MDKSNELNPQSCSTFEMTKYSLGACTESLVLNSFFGFSMLYYTKALGLGPEMAGIATFVATLWDAISDPVMGHISDNTRNRFGKRLPYMFVGGVLMIISFFFIWYVPDFFKTELVIGSTTISAMTMIFAYLVAMNLLLRTAYTVFVVPYTALGFEICTDYNGRSKLQGIRMGLNMAANLLGPATAWLIFFPNNPTTGEIKDTQIAQNYINMGAAFTVAAFVFLLLMLFFMAKYMKDSRQDTTCHGNVGAFFTNMKEILSDKYPRWVFVFMFFVLLGIVLVSTLQMFVFDDFMKLDGLQKTITHGGTMVGMGIGSLSLAFFVRRFDKKGAIYIAVTGSVLCELILAGLFLTGFMKPDQVIWQKCVPAGTVIQEVVTAADFMSPDLIICQKSVPVGTVIQEVVTSAEQTLGDITIPVGTVMADVKTTDEQKVRNITIPVGTIITDVKTKDEQRVGDISVPDETVIANVKATTEQTFEGNTIPVETVITGVEITTDMMIGGIPIAFILFTLLHGAYWFGNGILLPIAVSMMADVSEIHKIETGVNKDASYAAMFSLAMKISTAVSGLVAGYCLLWTGFQSGADVVQTPESVWRVCALTFVAGPLAQLAALILIRRYPVDQSFIEKMRLETAE
ncbi:MAG: MFS transporter [Planctomycetes bacterium]|nr:MFS transporter [Planctomycetota bacterium]